MLAQWISLAARRTILSGQNRAADYAGIGAVGRVRIPRRGPGPVGRSSARRGHRSRPAGPMAHAKALDVDAQGALRDVHRRVGTTVLFESSGGQVDKVAHLPELRFALAEPEVDTTTIDNAAPALETSAFFIRKVGTDGYRIHHQATLKKVVSDRRASLDEETEIKRRTSFTPRSPCRRPDGTPWRRDQSARSVAQWDLVCSQRRGVPQFPENRSSSERHLETHCHQVFDRLPLQAGAHRRRKQRPIRERERPMGCPARWW